MTTMAAGIEDRAFRAWTERLADLIEIETRIMASVDGWGIAVRDHQEATAMVERMRNVSKSHREALTQRHDPGARKRAPRASESRGVQATPASAYSALRQAAEVSFDATFACERAYQTARLSGDGDTCDLLESHLGDHAATVVEARRVLPHVVARELRGIGLTCECRCPMCSIGACGCVRATLAAAERAWGADEPARTSGLILHSPPRPGSQLAEAGLEEGDVILSVDGGDVASNGEAIAALRRHEVGEALRIDVRRPSGERTEVMVRRVR